MVVMLWALKVLIGAWMNAEDSLLLHELLLSTLGVIDIVPKLMVRWQISRMVELAIANSLVIAK